MPADRTARADPAPTPSLLGIGSAWVELFDIEIFKVFDVDYVRASKASGYRQFSEGLVSGVLRAD